MTERQQSPLPGQTITPDQRRSIADFQKMMQEGSISPAVCEIAIENIKRGGAGVKEAGLRKGYSTDSAPIKSLEGSEEHVLFKPKRAKPLSNVARESLPQALETFRANLQGTGKKIYNLADIAKALGYKVYDYPKGRSYKNRVAPGTIRLRRIGLELGIIASRIPNLSLKDAEKIAGIAIKEDLCTKAAQFNGKTNRGRKKEAEAAQVTVNVPTQEPNESFQDNPGGNEQNQDFLFTAKDFLILYIGLREMPRWLLTDKVLKLLEDKTIIDFFNKIVNNSSKNGRNNFTFNLEDFILLREKLKLFSENNKVRLLFSRKDKNPVPKFLNRLRDEIGWIFPKAVDIAHDFLNGVES